MKVLPLALAAVFAACGPSAAESGPRPLPPGLPEDTAFLVEDVPITRAEIDRWLPTFQLVEPAKSKHHLRRLVLTNYLLMRAVGGLIVPTDEREGARQVVTQVRQILEQGREIPPGMPQPVRLHDHWKSELGLDGWGAARELPEGEWSEVIEGVGSYRIVKRVASPDPEDWVGNTEATIEHITVYYLPPEDIKRVINDALGQVDIRVVDPAWERYLPTIYLHMDSPSE